MSAYLGHKPLVMLGSPTQEYWGRWSLWGYGDMGGLCYVSVPPAVVSW